MGSHTNDQALVLHTIQQGERGQILHLFTKEHGMVHGIASGGKKSPSLTPLTQAEFLLLPKEHGLWRCQEIAKPRSFAGTRLSYAHLQAACEMAKALRNTQPLLHPAPLLYVLTLTYLERLEEFPHPTSALCSFWLKLLKHEGLLGQEEPLMLQLAHSRSIMELSKIVVSEEVEKRVRHIFYKRAVNPWV